jgi:hypothetical protein
MDPTLELVLFIGAVVLLVLALVALASSGRNDGK